jgi:hypothetical protein
MLKEISKLQRFPYKPKKKFDPIMVILKLGMIFS